MTITTPTLTADTLAALAIEVPTDLWIGGAPRAASDGTTFSVHDPATGDELATVASASVEAAIAAAATWITVPPRQKGEILRRAFELMIERQEDLARLITLENGNALPDARSEVAYAAEFFRWYSEEAVRIRVARWRPRHPEPIAS